MTPTSVLTSDAPAPEPRAGLMHLYLRVLGAACAVAAVVFWFLPPGLNLAQHLLLALWFAAISGTALALAGVGDERQLLVVSGTSIAAIVGVGLSAWWTGWGLAAPGFAFLALVVCLARAGTDERHGLAVSLAAAVVLGTLGLAEGLGWIPGSLQDGGAPMAMRLGVMFAALAFSYFSGRVIDRVVVSYIRTAGEREQRFRSLLGIGADAYWETDVQLRLCNLSRRDVDGRFQPEPLPDPPVMPWEQPGVAVEAEILDTLRADMEQRARFRDLPVIWRSPRGHQRHVLVSGAPRFAPGGSFTGYWGVVRDVTTEVKARQALLAVESRYQELFNRMPTPLVLHRLGRIIDANPAALRLLGADRIEAVMNQPLLRWFEPGDSFQRALDAATQLEAMAPGQSLPLADYRLVTQQRRRTAVRASGVRVTTDAGPATLSFFIDDTERRDAQDAMRRSQELLVRVVAMSPDVITLTELTTGRYEMVNASFVRVTGWSAAEVVGRTATELGIWRSNTDRERLVALLREHDSLQDVPLDFMHRDGKRVLPMRVSATRFELEGRPYLVLSARDMSEVEHARLEREAILENAFIGIALTREQHFVLANPRFEQMLGWPEGTLAGQPARVCWSSDEAYAEFGRQVGPPLVRGEPAEVITPVARKDGSVFECRILGKAVNPQHPSGGGTIWIAEDITAQRQAEVALARARDDAEAANRAKSDFLANTSHEIRTPLNALMGLALLAREPGLDDPSRRRYLEQISDSAESLSAIISDILDLSRIEAGKLELDTVAFDLGELLEALHGAYAPLADASGLVLELDMQMTLPERVLGDALRLRQVLSNYLNNALKFTAAGRIVLRVVCAGPPRIRFEVEDTGCGIEPATQERLFHPFTQADASTTRRFGGTGLGLSICRELAHLMGGEVGVASEPGQGSRFWAELPLPPAGASGPETQLGTLDAQPLAGRRVLVVEDNPVNMMITAAMLQRWGAEVGQAEDGAQALTEVEAARERGGAYHAVLMDVQMPGMSGHEATAALRQRYDARTLPIIALTAAALVSERQQALAMGMNDFVTKPIDAQRLCDALLRVLEPATSDAPGP